MTQPVTHPTWCDPSRCGVIAGKSIGTHLSHPVVLGPHAPSSLVAEVGVMQGLPVAGYPLSARPLITMELRDGDGELCLVPLVTELARELGQVLIGFAQGADR
jgi:hypothetical protein